MTELRGRYITCQKCGYKFKILNKKKRQKWKNNKSICSICKEYYCTKPLTERQLFLLQDKYFEQDRDEKYIQEIIYILLNYSKSLILKSYSYLIKSTEDLKYFSENAVSFVIEEFYKKNNYKVHSSFAGLLLTKIKQAFFGKIEKPDRIDSGISLDWDFEDGKKVYYEDTDLLGEIKEKENKISIYKYVLNLITKIPEYNTGTKYDNMLMNIALLLYFNHGDTIAEKIFQRSKINFKNSSGGKKSIFIYDRKGKELYLESLDIIKKELYNLV